MTLVAAFATDNFILFAGDMRRTSTENESEFYDDWRKVYWINNKVLLGIYGDCYVSELILQFLRTQSLEDANVQAVTVKLRRYLKELLKEDKDMQQTVLIGGLGDGDKITLITMDHKDKYDVSKIIPEPNHFKWHSAFAEIEPSDIIQDEIDKHIDNGEALSIEKVEKISKEMIKKVSEQDKYVSPTYHIEYFIRK